VALSAPAPISTSTPSEIAPKDPPRPDPESHPPQRHPLKVSSSSLNGTTFTAVTFDRRDYFLKVIDQKEGPGTEFARAEFAGTRKPCRYQRRIF
jgi:hypothetical protein